MLEIPLAIKYIERGLSKSLKKFNFRIQFLLMVNIMKNKRGLLVALQVTIHLEKVSFISDVKSSFIILTKFDDVI